MYIHPARCLCYIVTFNEKIIFKLYLVEIKLVFYFNEFNTKISMQISEIVCFIKNK